MCGKKIALYCRVAHKDQRAMDTQYERLKQFAVDQGLAPCVSYLDNGYSGISDERLSFRRMNADIACGKIGTVVVTDASRLWRRVDKLCSWLAFVDRHKASVVFSEESADAMEFAKARKKERA